MKARQYGAAHDKVECSRTNEGCEVLSLCGVDRFGQQWEPIFLRTKPLALEPNSIERVYTHRTRSAG
jgi:hypothetical protein